MFEGLSPEVAALLDAAAADLPTAQADAGLLAAMAEAVSVGVSAPSTSPRKRKMLGKVLTAKAAAIAGVLVLSGGVASAATGSLPDPAQDAASNVANVVGLDIPKSDKAEAKEHPENHGKDVSTVAHDPENEGADHGSAVCTVASEGKCQPNADEDNSGKGNSADHRQDGTHQNRGSGDDDAVENDDDATTSTTIEDNANDDGADHDAGDDNPGEQSGKGKSGHDGGSDDSGHDSSDD
jgi:hypothetical protein